MSPKSLRDPDKPSTVIIEIAAENFLSLRKVQIKFRPLLVLVGPNGSGKSNFLNLFRFIGEVARTDLIPAVDQFGGYDQLFFRGLELPGRAIKIELKGQITEHSSENAPDEYKLSFVRINSASRRLVLRRSEDFVFKRFRGPGRRITISGKRIVFGNQISKPSSRGTERSVSVQSASSGLATLRRLGEEYGAEQVDALATVFEDLRLFEVDVDRAKRPSPIVISGTLEADGSNIAAFLNYLRIEHEYVFEALCDDMRFVLPGFRGFQFSSIGGAGEGVRVDIEEDHLDGVTPLARASFGTLRSICLFAMLHDPNPPKLTCMEEVDHGLHPHALDRLVDRLREASARTQVIVVTHSPALVNRLEPEELVVFERDVETGATINPDLTPKQMKDMQEETDYRLGELWFSGALGGGL